MPRAMSRQAKVAQAAIFVLAVFISGPANAVFCPECGNPRDDSYKFCPMDGTNLAAVRGTLGKASSKQLDGAPTMLPDTRGERQDPDDHKSASGQNG